MSAAKKLRVLLADDHRIVRDGLRLLIEAQPDMSVVGEAGNGNEVLAQARALKPDIVVMDLSMPGLNGLQATEVLKAELPALKVVALTAHDDETYLSQVCRAGAAGYVLKQSAGEELIQALSTVAKGGVYFETALASRALARQMANPGARPALLSAELSPREREVLTRVAWGYSNKEIARDLTLSVKTVETYKARMADKLGLRSRTEMVQFALRQGWLNEGQPCPPKLK